MGKIRIVPPRRPNDPTETGLFFQNVAREINKTAPGSCTLTANAGTTTVLDTNVLTTSAILLFSTSANAAADVAAGNVYVSAKTNGTSFVITHPNNANADKTFDYVVLAL